MDKLFPFLIATLIIVFIGTVVIFSVESGQPNSEINSMLDAVWWTVSTITTVGYGDIVPVTDTGKIIAIVYMIFGIAILAVFLSALGTRFYKKRFESEDKEISHAQNLILKKMDNLERNQENFQKELNERFDKLERKLD